MTLETATEGAKIYYTDNGSEPSTSSTLYSQAISVTAANSTIKAIAGKEGMANSDVMSITYTNSAAAAKAASRTKVKAEE